MSFTRELFERTTNALPGTTAREFSRYCGKSEGYYGSISSQDLEISTSGLIYLAGLLHAKNSIEPNEKIRQVLAMITNEVADRTKRIQCENEAVRRMMIKAVAHAYMQGSSDYSAPPIVIA